MIDGASLTLSLTDAAAGKLKEIDGRSAGAKSIQMLPPRFHVKSTKGRPVGDSALSALKY